MSCILAIALASCAADGAGHADFDSIAPFIDQPPASTMSTKAASTTVTTATTTSLPTTTSTLAQTTTSTTTTTAAPTTTAPPTTTTSTTTTKPPPTTTTTAAQSCHPSYVPCLEIVSDYDCAGGSGNGPLYTGRVQVIGPDDYGLDRDGDGIGCEK